MKSTYLAERITTRADRCGGRPCIRESRIRVKDVLDLLAAGLTADQAVEELPYLEKDDVYAAIAFDA